MKLHSPYTETDWQADRTAQKAGPLACPDCGSNRCYVAHERSANGKMFHYAACKMCGLWREANGTDAYRCWRSVHVCIRHIETPYTCPHCEQTFRVEPEGITALTHLCWKALLPRESGYACLTCGRYYGRESQVPWPLRGSD